MMTSSFSNLCANLSIVVQGPYHSNLPQILLQLQRLFPESQIIWSSFHCDKVSKIPDFVERIHSTDPGALDRSVFGGRINCSIRRQVANFAAGLEIANREYLLKIRSDLYIFDRSIVQMFLSNFANDKCIFVVNSESTHKPSLLYPSFCHFGDWLFIGKREHFTPLLSVDLKKLKDTELNSISRFEKFQRVITGIGYQTTSCEMEIWRPVLSHCLPSLVLPQTHFSVSRKIKISHAKLRDQHIKLVTANEDGYMLLKKEYYRPAWTHHLSYDRHQYNNSEFFGNLKRWRLRLLKLAYRYYCFALNLRKLMR